jgi:hypothetical protein
MVIRSRKLRPSRSSFHTVSVSPCSSFLRHRRKAGRLAVAPDLPSSLKMVLHPAFFRAASCRAGSGRQSRRGHNRISRPPSCTDICNIANPLFTGLPAMMQNLPFAAQNPSRPLGRITPSASPAGSGAYRPPLGDGPSEPGINVPGGPAVRAPIVPTPAPATGASPDRS